MRLALFAARTGKRVVSMEEFDKAKEQNHDGLLNVSGILVMFLRQKKTNTPLIIEAGHCHSWVILGS